MKNLEEFSNKVSIDLAKRKLKNIIKIRNYVRLKISELSIEFRGLENEKQKEYQLYLDCIDDVISGKIQGSL